jgi:catechol 2,3-dioxygenase-like lactoylglutathione lyase family enzyme
MLPADNAPAQQRMKTMKPHISVITLAVADLERATRFYRDGLGLPIREDKPPVVYFQLRGTWLALFPRQALARYANVPADGQGFAGITLSCNVASREEVDETASAAEQAGATIVSPPHQVGWGGYTAWFSDPDGHLWEIVWNPNPFMD